MEAGEIPTKSALAFLDELWSFNHSRIRESIQGPSEAAQIFQEWSEGTCSFPYGESFSRDRTQPGNPQDSYGYHIQRTRQIRRCQNYYLHSRRHRIRRSRISDECLRQVGFFLRGIVHYKEYDSGLKVTSTIISSLVSFQFKPTEFEGFTNLLGLHCYNWLIL